MKNQSTNNRYLFAGEYFSDKAIGLWKDETRLRCKDKPQGKIFHDYIQWERQDHEIAVFTMYAYADLAIPKEFDIIFEINQRENFVKTKYCLTKCLWEAWYPTDFLGLGHKHLCIFSFEQSIPSILYLLHKNDGMRTTAPTGQVELGFCTSEDFREIKKG